MFTDNATNWAFTVSKISENAIKDAIEQQRGNSVRIGHYVGYKNETSVIKWHSVEDFMAKNGKESMVKNKAENTLIIKNSQCGCSLAWLGHQVPKTRDFDHLDWVYSLI